MFPHQEPDFGDMLQAASVGAPVALPLLEKDYWITHVLWVLHETGLEVHFKGGTSLSKGFGLIRRFSEDLDLQIDAGTASLPRVSSWKSEGKTATGERSKYFGKIGRLVSEQCGLSVAVHAAEGREDWKSCEMRVEYPGNHVNDLPGFARPYVFLEVGKARIVPFERRPLTSFLHDFLARSGATYDNTPKSVRCVHPYVTLIEKIDALARRFPTEAEPAKFVRHYEDCASILRARAGIAPMEGYESPLALVKSMLEDKSIRANPSATAPSLSPDSTPRWDDVRRAYAAIEEWYWGPRIPLDDACREICDFIRTAVPPSSTA
jgi:hypothetical protein